MARTAEILARVAQLEKAVKTRDNDLKRYQNQRKRARKELRSCRWVLVGTVLLAVFLASPFLLHAGSILSGRKMEDLVGVALAPISALLERLAAFGDLWLIVAHILAALIQLPFSLVAMFAVPPLMLYMILEDFPIVPKVFPFVELAIAAVIFYQVVTSIHPYTDLGNARRELDVANKDLRECQAQRREAASQLASIKASSEYQRAYQDQQERIAWAQRRIRDVIPVGLSVDVLERFYNEDPEKAVAVAEFLSATVASGKLEAAKLEDRGVYLGVFDHYFEKSQERVEELRALRLEQVEDQRLDQKLREAYRKKHGGGSAQQPRAARRGAAAWVA